jgi:hypothetical protein
MSIRNLLGFSERIFWIRIQGRFFEFATAIPWEDYLIYKKIIKYTSILVKQIFLRSGIMPNGWLEWGGTGYLKK